MSAVHGDLTWARVTRRTDGERFILLERRGNLSLLPVNGSAELTEAHPCDECGEAILPGDDFCAHRGRLRCVACFGGD